jgi:Endonuclease/Exonuclease/phosphatase family
MTVLVALIFSVLLPVPGRAEVIKVMGANLISGGYPYIYYFSPSRRLFQGLEPDIVLIQEFRVNSGTLRDYVDEVFGSEFYLYTGSGGFPNGIISRYPFKSSGEWDDPYLVDREFSWAVIDIPGTTDLQVVSVHLKASTGPDNRTKREGEATYIKDYVQTNFDNNHYILVGGDLNTYHSPVEPCISVFASFLEINDHIPVDRYGDSDTNENRNERYDWLMPNQVLDDHHTTLRVGTGSQAFPEGIVFDSWIFTPLGEVSPVEYNDSHGTMTHMGVMKAYTTSDIPTPTPGPPSPTPTAAPPTPTPFSVIESGDYNGDGTSDIAIFRPQSGLWAIRGLSRLYYGLSSAITISGDYSGNGTTDIAVYIPQSGLWAARDISRVYYGTLTDIPIPGDYNGDGTVDVGIFRSSSGLWAVRSQTRVYYGASTDSPVPGDWNGDGTADVGIFRQSSGLWAIRGISRVYYGSSGDRVIPGDYNGDGAFDFAIYGGSAGLWAIRNISRLYFGNLIDNPVPADYTGDGSDNCGLFRASSSLWAIKGITRAHYGHEGDIPVTR